MDEEHIDDKYGGDLRIMDLKEVLLDLATVMHANYMEIKSSVQDIN